MEFWPFYPRSVSSAVGHESLSYLVAGVAEHLKRAVCIIEPIDSIADTVGRYNKGEYRNLNLGRIDPPDQWQRCEAFCNLFRNGSEINNQHCCDFDMLFAARCMKDAYESTSDYDYAVSSCPCHVGMIDFSCPVVIGRKLVGVALAGQFVPSNIEDPEKMVFAAAAAKWEAGKSETLLASLRSSHSVESYLDSIGNPKADFKEFFQDAIHRLETIFESEWSASKLGRERGFLDKLEKEFLRSGDHRSRGDLAEDSKLFLEMISNFFGVSFVTVLTTSQERISKKPNHDILSFFSGYGVPPLGANDVRAEWQGKGNGDFEAEPNQRFKPSGFRGVGSKYLRDASVSVPFALSDKHKAIIVFGKFRHLDDEDIQHELNVIKEVATAFANWLLLQLESVDSEVIASAWVDTAGLLAHNARRALNPIDACASVIKAYVAGRASKDYLETVADTMSWVVGSLGQQIQRPLETYAAAAEGTLQIQKQAIAPIVRQCVNIVEEAAKSKRINIELDQSIDGLPPVELDKTQYSMALGHIFDNAIKYSHEGKTVSVSGHVDANYVKISVDDFGLGIAPDDEEAIYHKKTQGMRSRRADEEIGDGWGLYHARVIARAHGGDITHEVSSGKRNEIASSFLEGYRVVFTISTPITVVSRDA